MKKTKLTTTFALLRDRGACSDGYRKLAKHLGGVEILVLVLALVGLGVWLARRQGRTEAERDALGLRGLPAVVAALSDWLGE